MEKDNNKGFSLLMDCEWVIKAPIDLEQKQYVLLSYFQKLNEKLDNFMLYPTFIELSLHMANILSLIRDRKFMYTDKEFKSLDDEILVTDLKVKDVPQLTKEQNEELFKILIDSEPKIQYYFEIAKSVWMILYDNVGIHLKKNKSTLRKRAGYFYYTNNDNKTYIWEFKTKKVGKSKYDYKLFVNLIYETDNNFDIYDIIKNNSDWNNVENNNKLPIFQLTSNSDYPINESLLPIFKRKVLNYINQTVK